MNGLQQREHRTVTQALETRVADLETLVAHALPTLRRADDAVREEVHAVAWRVLEWRARGVWGRLRWLVRGV